MNRWLIALRITVFITCAIPAIDLILDYYQNELGFNPFERLMHSTGHAAIILLISTLAVTPLRRWLAAAFTLAPSLKWGKRLSDWNFLIRIRAMIGLYSFFYASGHLLLYVYLELGFQWLEFLRDMDERSFILLGFIAWCFLLLLAITSPNRIRRSLGPWWRRIHRLIYPLSILALVHYYLFLGLSNYTFVLYAGLVVIFLVHRLVVAKLRSVARADDDGMEVAPADRAVWKKATSDN